MQGTRLAKRIDPGRHGQDGLAIVMVLLVLLALAAIGAPFVISMALQEKSSIHFEGGIKARKSAEGARNHVLSSLGRTHRARESEAEAEQAGVLAEFESVGSSGRAGGRASARRAGSRSARRDGGIVIREDLGERSSRGDRGGRRGRRGRGDRESDERAGLPALVESKLGPTASSFDPPGDLDAKLPDSLLIPASAPRVGTAQQLRQEAAAAASPRSRRTSVSQPEMRVDFRDPRGIYASARAVDEQGKVNLNTAPPQLLANLLGVSVLTRHYRSGDEELVLEDASGFRTDGDPQTIDGAVLIVAPKQHWGEAFTYRERRSDRLRGLFRGAFFAVKASEKGEIVHRAGSFVYDLRGWKIGYHKFRSGSMMGFRGEDLVEFQTVEAVRDISNWQMTSLFLERFRGEGLTEEFLVSSGIRASDLAQAGLDPALFESDEKYKTGFRKALLDDANRILRRLGLSSFSRRLLKERGGRAVIDFAARVEPLTSREAKEEAERIEEALKRRPKKTARFDRDYVKAVVLEHLPEVYASPAIETLSPQELEALRELVTVSSSVAAKWSEAQTVEGRVSPAFTEEEEETGLSLRRPGSQGGGAVFRLSHYRRPQDHEYNVSRSTGVKGFLPLFPVERSYGAGEARIEFLERHPVNVNTAPPRVLEAIFTSVAHARGNLLIEKEGERAGQLDSPGIVTPSEARAIAARVISARPLHGPADFRNVLEGAVGGEQIHSLDAEALYANSIQPNHFTLASGTTGFVYALGDVYTIESHGILRDPAGGEIHRTGLRELVDVAPAGQLRWTLFTQQDFTSEVYFRNPLRSVPSFLSYPEDHFYNSISFPGMESHLVRSTPVHLKHETVVTFGERTGNLSRGRSRSGGTVSMPSFPLPGAEIGTLRLAMGETQESQFDASGRGVYHFREGRNETLDLPGGEPWPLDITLGNSGQGGNASGPLPPGAFGGQGGQAGGAVVGGSDLTNVPASIEAWVRFRTFPSATTSDGLMILMDAGVEEDRNRISLLYDRRRSEWVARMFDGSLPDPSIKQGEQRIEIRAQRPLELDTWYHVRLAWDGMFRGGLQLFIDGLPVGHSNFQAELAGDLSVQSGNLPLRGAQGLPREGVVRVGNELVEYEDGRIRQQAPSFFQKWLVSQQLGQTTTGGALPPGAVPGGNLPPGMTSAEAAALNASLQPSLKRGAWEDDPGNQRGTVRSHHISGTPVSLHGYALEVFRKTWNPQLHLHQALPGELILGTGGLQLAEDLLPFDFPADVARLVNFNPQPTQAGASGGSSQPTGGSSPSGSMTEILAPVFRLRMPQGGGAAVGRECAGMQKAEALFNRLGLVLGEGSQLPVDVFSATMEWAGHTYNAADWFQSRGYCSFFRRVPDPDEPGRFEYEDALEEYNKVALPAGHPATISDCLVEFDGVYVPCESVQGGTGVALLARISFPMIVLCETQTVGLRPQGGNATGGNGVGTLAHDGRITLRSVLANGPVQGNYPTAGLIELRGSPAPWHQPARPDLRGSDVFGAHPDDTVEWIRYHQVDRDMFVYPSGGRHRDYPRGRNHMYHRGVRPPGMASASVRTAFGGRGAPGGEPLRQVIEVGKGDAGYGDYVSIVTDDPRVFEPQLYRVYRTLERDDGRFFLSVYAPGDGLGYQPLRFRNRYVRDDPNKTMVVKFPSGALPNLASGRAVFFGDAIRGSFDQGLRSLSQFEDLEEEPDTGHVLDEVRSTRNEFIDDSLDSKRVRHVVVPLQNGRVQRTRAGDGGETLGGFIPAGRTINRSSPLEVLVVSIGNEPGSQLFAPTEKRGVLRINDELFFFENPTALQSQGSAQGGSQGSLSAARGTLQSVRPIQTAQSAQAVGSSARDLIYGGQRDPTDRLQPYRITAQANGYYENEGFARIHFTSRSLGGLYEVFYYQSRSGGTFNNCLRGQFSTALFRDQGAIAFDPNDPQPIQANPQQNALAGSVFNATVKLRLIGRSLLGTKPAVHAFGDRVSFVHCVDMTEIQGPLTDSGLAVTDTRVFPPVGYALIDPATGGRPFEILAYTGRMGENLLRRPVDEQGHGILRSCFGTQPQPIARGMFAYAMPFRYFDRFEPKVESPYLAYFQKSFRERDAVWRRILWKEREGRIARERLADIVIAVRFNGSPDWSVEPTNTPDGLYFFEDAETTRGAVPSASLGVKADQLDLRVYFRYRPGAFQRLAEGIYRDDWKETPVLDTLVVEYEKAGRILRREETEF